ncbi:MAG: glycosyltransferase family 4 protein [Candidatus Hydrogenedentes bacterium]|jgi:glycosyltransferase involved in cell wall biosynthesis|nr:glycosyltransferase family 4 protein [Candidatus Hydrogenedentota bacterium]
MRLAFIDLVFSWPPLGGAPLDLYYTMTGLQELGHEVHLFYAEEKDNWFLEAVQEERLPFPATALAYDRNDADPRHLSMEFCTVVDEWKPDVVFQCFGFFMKPFVMQALAHYPQIIRYYAYEPFCPRDYRLYWKKKTCPKNYLRTPNACRRCTARGMHRVFKSSLVGGYALEYKKTRAWTPEYYKVLVDSIRSSKAVIVYNHFTKGLLGNLNKNVHVIGGGVHLEHFNYVPLEEKPASEPTVIFMSGRADDGTKGLDTLMAAGKILWRERQDFQIQVTIEGTTWNYLWFKELGWCDVEKARGLYTQSDICVVPSRWEEPFGLVATEAMACGRPCVVSDVGGLKEIVVPEETGFIFRRGKPKELARCLCKLLDDPALRRQMGDAGRKRVEDIYEWKKVIQTHYPPILEAAVR